MQLNFAAVLKYSLVTYVDIIRDRCQKQKTEMCYRPTALVRA